MQTTDKRFGYAPAEILYGKRNDPLAVQYERDDFGILNVVAGWVSTAATAGTSAIIDGAGGLLELDSASATADQGIQVQRIKEMWLPAAGKDLLFETRLKVTDTVDKVQLFAGLSVTDTTIFASGEISAADYIGYVLDATEQGGSNAGKPALQLDSTAGSEEKLSAVTTLAEGIFVRLGFYLHGTSSLVPLVNGIPGTALDITSCPATELAISFACLTEGTNDPIAVVDWYECIQLR